MSVLSTGMLSVSLLSLAGACALMSARLGLGEHHGAIWSLRCSETACSWMSKHKALTSTHLYCGGSRTQHCSQAVDSKMGGSLHWRPTSQVLG